MISSPLEADLNTYSMTKKFLLGIVGATALGMSAQGQLLLTSVFDGPLSGGLPKGVEIYVTEDIADLSLFQLANYNNGATTATAFFNLSGSATAGSFLYYAYDGGSGTPGTTGFTSFFGFAPTFSGSAINVNGDDAIAIRLVADSSVLDVYGVIGVDGTGTAWEYLDGWGYRNVGTTASPIFDEAAWTYSGVDQLEGGTTNDTTLKPVPVGTYAVPEPGTVALVGLGLGAVLFGVRRRAA